MTHPTKAIVGTLLKDFVKVSGGRSDGALYTEKDLEKTLDVTEVIDFHQTVEVAGIQVCQAAELLPTAMIGIPKLKLTRGKIHSLAFLQSTGCSANATCLVAQKASVLYQSSNLPQVLVICRSQLTELVMSWGLACLRWKLQA